MLELRGKGIDCVSRRGLVSNLDPTGLRVYGVRVDSEKSRSKSVPLTLLLFGTNEVSR